MNALADNDYAKTLHCLGEKLPRPKAILCVSAHWYVDGTHVSVSPVPKTIHDFVGFPPELYAINYAAKGHPAFAQRAQDLVGKDSVRLTGNWGLDHGCWSILVHLYPKADVPVFQISIHMKKTPQQHFNLAAKLKPLRDEGVLILGSGNISHNLRRMDHQPHAEPYPWTAKFDSEIKNAVLKNDYDRLIQYEKSFPDEAPLAVPSPDHYLPFIYALAASEPSDPVSFPFEGFEHGSISMRSVQWG